MTTIPTHLMLPKLFHAAVIVFITGMILIVDLLPREGPPEFRYNGSDPEKTVLNLGWPVANFIYDESHDPALIVGPMTEILITIQLSCLAMIIMGPPLIAWGWRRLSRGGNTSPERQAGAVPPIPR